MEAIAESHRHGLDADCYHVAAIEAAVAEHAWPEAELLMSDAFLCQIRHRALGALDPAAVDPDWLIVQEKVDGVAALGAVADGADPRRELDLVWPTAPGYWALVQARTRLNEGPAWHETALPSGPLMRPARRDPRVPMLRLRLGSRGRGDVYDDSLVDAVVEFQRIAGIERDGIVGPITIGELNRTRSDRLAQVDANLERWRWLPRSLPATRLVVNVAAFELTAAREGRREFTMAVITGRADRPTPAMSSRVESLVFNPYWDIPESIAVEDKLPELRKDPSRLARQGVEAALIGSDEMVPVDRIDWGTVTAPSLELQPDASAQHPARHFPYRLRQRPGPYNPLGRLKFVVPSDHAIYLHDTPDTSLFDRCERSFSAGCVRVADAARLAEWILGLQADPWDRDQVDAHMRSDETSGVKLDTFVPMVIVYMTSYVDSEGTLRFQRDLYGRDAPVVEALTRVRGGHAE